MTVGVFFNNRNAITLILKRNSNLSNVDHGATISTNYIINYQLCPRLRLR